MKIKIEYYLCSQRAPAERIGNSNDSYDILVADHVACLLYTSDAADE